METQMIGARVRQAILECDAPAPQYVIAQAVDMKPDALSRAINGQRAFSSIELASLAGVLARDVHWLITGEKDPQRVVFAARHTFDHETGARDVPGAESDHRVLRDIELAYRQAGDLGSSEDIPATPAEVRIALGDDFVAPFLKRLEERLGVHVVRVPELSTAYCFSIDGRDVIAIRATGNWFYENFCLAHELAHLAAGHLTGRAISNSEEVAANAFAAELLMPSDLVRKRGFNQITAEGLAQWVWEQGVSTDATARRTAALGILTSNVVSEWSTQTTQKLLRRHGYPAEPGRDEISDRMAAATTRHFPQELVRAHIARIEEGLIGPEVLAWMLDVDVAEIDLKAPQLPSSDVDKFAAELGLSPAQ